MSFDPRSGLLARNTPVAAIRSFPKVLRNCAPLSTRGYDPKRVGLGFSLEGLNIYL